MPRVLAPPFRRPAPIRIAAEPWFVQLMGDWKQLPTAIPDWDPLMPLRFTRVIGIDCAAIRGDCGLPGSALLRLVVIWRSDAAGMHDLAFSRDLPSSAEESIQVDFEVPADRVGGVLSLETQLIVSNVGMTDKPFVPKISGSVIWQHVARIALEGSASRFPIQVVDFGATIWAHEGAAWQLVWNPHDMERPFMGNVRLYVNSARELVVAAVKSPKATAENAAIASALYFDVGRSLVLGAVQQSDFLTEIDRYEPGSTGHAVSRLIRLIAPHDGAVGLANMLKESPSDFDALLQAKLHLFERI